jgi:UDP-3-O-[3-hydroxymyristoyl] glucosamine N-acyltransferase
MAAQVGIAGSAKIGPGCMFGGQVGLRDGIEIGGGVVIGAQAGVPANIDKPGVYLGSPAMPIKEFWRMTAAQMKLPELVKRLKAIEKKTLERGE